MTPEPVSLEVERVVNKLEEIAAELKGMREDQEAIRTNQDAVRNSRRRERKQFFVLCVSVALDIALSVALAVMAAGQVSATDTIRDNQARLQQTQEQFHDSQVANCEAANVTRWENKTYQLFFLQILSAPIADQPAPTVRARAEIRQRLAELSNRLNVIYAPVDCAKRFPPAPGT